MDTFKAGDRVDSYGRVGTVVDVRGTDIQVRWDDGEMINQSGRTMPSWSGWVNWCRSDSFIVVR